MIEISCQTFMVLLNQHLYNNVRLWFRHIGISDTSYTFDDLTIFISYAIQTHI